MAPNVGHVLSGGNGINRQRGCYNCGDSSHFRQNCQNLVVGAINNGYQTAPPTNVQTQPATGTRGCYNCGDPSHFRRNCPSAMNSQQVQRPPRPQMSRVSTSQKGGRVYLMLKIKGQPVQCLLDSGCDQTLIPLDVIKPHKSIKMKPTTKVVIAANRSE